MEFNKPRVNAKNVKDFKEFEKCIYVLPKSLNDSYGVMVLFEDGYSITVQGAPGEGKRVAVSFAKDRLWKSAQKYVKEKTSLSS